MSDELGSAFILAIISQWKEGDFQGYCKRSTLNTPDLLITPTHRLMGEFTWKSLCVFLVHKTFPEISSKMTLQHSPEQL